MERALSHGRLESHARSERGLSDHVFLVGLMTPKGMVMPRGEHGSDRQPVLRSVYRCMVCVRRARGWLRKITILQLLVAVWTLI